MAEGYKVLGFSEYSSFAEFLDSLVNNILRSDGILLKKDYGVYLVQYIFEGQSVSWHAVGEIIKDKINALCSGIKCRSFAVDIDEENSRVEITLALRVSTSFYSEFGDAQKDYIFPISFTLV